MIFILLSGIVCLSSLSNAQLSTPETWVRQDDQLTILCSSTRIFNSAYVFVNKTIIGYILHPLSNLSIIEGLLEDRSIYKTWFGNTEFTLTIVHVITDSRVEIQLFNGSDFIAKCERVIKVYVRVYSLYLTPDLANMSVIAGTPTQLQCTTSPGIPAPTVRWFKTSGSPGSTPLDITSQSYGTLSENGTSSTLSLTPSIGDHGCRIYCTAENLGYTVISTKTPKLNVLYAPSVPVCSYRGQKETGPVRIIRGSTFTVYCTSDSNPVSTYTWIYPGGSYTGQNLTIHNIQILNGGRFTVQAYNTMVPTGSIAGVSKTGLTTIEVDALYEPSSPTFSVGSTSVSRTLKVISGNYTIIRCSSQSNPPPTYTWTPGGTGNNPDLVLINEERPTRNGQYTCNVETTMNPTRGISRTDRRNGTLIVEFLENDAPVTTSLGAIIGGACSGVAIICIVCCMVWIMRKHNIKLFLSKKAPHEDAAVKKRTTENRTHLYENNITVSTPVYENDISIQNGSTYQSLGVRCQNAEYSSLQEVPCIQVQSENRKTPNLKDHGDAIYMNQKLAV